MDIEIIITQILNDLQSAADPDRGKMQKKYLKSPFKFFGVSRPGVQSIARKVKKEFPDLAQTDLLILCARLWNSEHHECKSIAIDLLNLFPHHIDNSAHEFIDHMINTATGWDHIDEIAIRLVGRLLVKDTKNFNYLRECERSDNFWKRRVSIIAQLKLYKTPHFDKNLFFDICKAHLHEKEFFIRKAIGWGLRELSKSDQRAVYDFIRINQVQMSGLTFREGSKRLPEKLRADLLNRRSEK